MTNARAIKPQIAVAPSAIDHEYLRTRLEAFAVEANDAERYHFQVHRREQSGDPDQRRTTLDYGYEDLSPQAFALWLRLQTLEPLELRGGCCSMAEQLGVAPRSLNRWLHELRRRGYVEMMSNGRGGKLRVALARRTLVVRSPSTVITL